MQAFVCVGDYNGHIGLGAFGSLPPARLKLRPNQ